ncbi:MAG: hypothetical protein U7127_26095 [Phormidium sp.]
MFCYLCDRTTSKKCARFFQLSLEKAIALFVLVGKVRLGCFWLCDRTMFCYLCDRTTSKKCDRFFQLGLENAIALFRVNEKKCDR